MRRVEENADREWWDRGMAYLGRMARACPEFTAEDLWIAGLDKPREPRAIGALMQAGKRAGLIERTDRTRQSKSKLRHAGDSRVWRSLVYA